MVVAAAADNMRYAVQLATERAVWWYFPGCVTVDELEIQYLASNCSDESAFFRVGDVWSPRKLTVLNRREREIGLEACAIQGVRGVELQGMSTDEFRDIFAGVMEISSTR